MNSMCGGFDAESLERRDIIAFCKWLQGSGAFHYILHYITLHYITLHYSALHITAFQHFASSCIKEARQPFILSERKFVRVITITIIARCQDTAIVIVIIAISAIFAIVIPDYSILHVFARKWGSLSLQITLHYIIVHYRLQITAFCKQLQGSEAAFHSVGEEVCPGDYHCKMPGHCHRHLNS